MDDLAAPPPPPPPLRLPLPQDDLLVEILLRLPPEPIYLLRASLVCKHWRRLVGAAGFLRRFRAFHGGAPPLLGFFEAEICTPFFFFPMVDSFFKVSPLRPDGPGCFMDCRHGRALLSVEASSVLLVWDLMTGEKIFLSMPDGFCGGHCNGAVLSAAGHDDSVDVHLTPFLVVLVCADDEEGAASGCVYSSETGSWGDVITVSCPECFLGEPQAAYVGNSVYFEFIGNHMLEFNLERRRLDIIRGPYGDRQNGFSSQVFLRTADGGLGVAAVKKFRLRFWSRVADSEGVAKWQLGRTIDLEQLFARKMVLKCHMGSGKPKAVCFVEDDQVIFISMYHYGYYAIHLKSMHIEWVRTGTDAHYFGSTIYPYKSFYTAGVSVGIGDDPAELMR